ncbi:MAG: hypothetical protein WEB37_06305 [Bacteroidota bacterium]
MMSIRIPMLSALYVVIFSACGGGAVESMLSPAQRFAVEDLLREHKNAELVQPTECTNSLLARYQSEHPNYSPYYAEADFNGDGSLDFVIATKVAGAYDLWLFLGSVTEYRRPENFLTLTWLNEGGLIVQGRNLFVGKFYSDDGTTFAWDSMAGRFALYSPEMP